MNNPTLLKTFSYLAFVVSAIFTIILMTSAVVGFIATGLTIGMAIMLEVCKVGFFNEALTNTRLNIAVRVTMGVISILLLLSSIVASAGYIQNMTNKTKNLELKHSSAFKQAEEGKGIQKDLYTAKQQEIESIKSNYSSQIEEMTKVKNSYPANYFTRKENLQVEINNKSSEMQNMISEKNKELVQLGNKLETPIDVSTLNVNKTNGYSAIFSIVADKINQDEFRETTISADEIELYFFMGLSVIFEFIAIITMYLSRVINLGQLQLGNTPNRPTKKTTDYEIKPNFENIKPNNFKIIKPNIKPNFENINLAKANRSLSLVASSDFPPKKTPKSFKSIEVEEYLKYMYENATESDGELVSPGYIKISKNTSLSQEKCRKIKAWLEEEGTLKSEGGKTIILEMDKTLVG